LDRAWLFILLYKVGVVPASPFIIFLHRSRNSPQKADYFKTHSKDVHVWIMIMLYGISNFEPMASLTGHLVYTSVCSVAVDSTVSWRQISVLLFTHVTVAVSVWELPIRTSVGVQQAMEAPTVSRVSSVKLVGRTH
jgi:hypothetical protein